MVDSSNEFYEPITDRVQELLRCPACGHRFREDEESLICTGCGDTYPSPLRGRPDLRLRRVIERSVIRRVGEPPLTTDGLALEPLRPCESRMVDFIGVAVPWHLTKVMLSYFPKAETPGKVALDLGCGRAIHREVIERAGFEYVGVDYQEQGAPILADAHALPFVDESFDFVLNVAVLEHIRDPFGMIEETARVMKPGAMLIGTVAFLEPWHDQSYFHHSHLGIVNVLHHAGLKIESVAPNRGWSVLQAQAKALFPLVPPWLARTVTFPLHALHRLWWLPIGWRSARHAKLRRLKTAGAFTFIAKKTDLGTEAN